MVKYLAHSARNDTVNRVKAAIIDGLSNGLALQYIQDRGKTLNEISFMLGFSEASSFSRAFKAWTGKPPSVARQPVE